MRTFKTKIGGQIINCYYLERDISNTFCLIHKSIHAKSELFFNRQRTDDILTLFGLRALTLRSIPGLRSFEVTTPKKRGYLWNDGVENSLCWQYGNVDAWIDAAVILKAFAVHLSFLSVWLFADENSFNQIENSNMTTVWPSHDDFMTRYADFL